MITKDTGMLFCASRYRPLKVIVSIITLWSFFFSIVGTNLAWAARTPLEPTRVGSNRAGGLAGDPAFSFDVSNISVPLKLGEIKETFKGTNGKTIIHIQDAHCNYAAQSSIEGIISHLTNTYNNVDLVSLEGGKGNYDLSIFTDIKDQDVRKKVSDYFVKEGRVNGAEFFAINNPEKVKLFGIEDEKLYKENLNTYRGSLTSKEEADKYLNILSAAITNLKLKSYSPQLKEIDEKIKEYKDSKIDFKSYLTFLTEKSKISNINIKDYKNINSLMLILGDEKLIDFKEADRERNKLIDKINSKVSKKDLEELVIKSVQFKAGDITNEEFYSYLFRKAKFSGVNFDTLPNLVKYSEYIKKYETLDKAGIFKEIKDLENTLINALAKTDEQKELYLLDRDLSIIKGMLNISLVKEEFDYYTANKDTFRIKRFVDFINTKAPLYGFNFKLNNGIEKLDSYRENMEKFYVYSLKRDDAFIKNIEKKLKDENKNVTILVTGGFHTGNLSKLFKDKGYSYIEVMPKFGQMNGECPYFKLLAGEGNDFDKFLRKAVTPATSTIAIESLFSQMGIEQADKDMIRLKVALLRKMLAVKGGEGFRFVLGTVWGNIIFTENAAIENSFAIAPLGIRVNYSFEPLREYDLYLPDLVLERDGSYLTQSQQEISIDERGKAVGIETLEDGLKRAGGLTIEGLRKELKESFGLTDEQITVLLGETGMHNIFMWKRSIGKIGGHYGKREHGDTKGEKVLKGLTALPELAEYGVAYVNPVLSKVSTNPQGNPYRGIAIGILHEVGEMYDLPHGNVPDLRAPESNLKQYATTIVGRINESNRRPILGGTALAIPSAQPSEPVDIDKIKQKITAIAGNWTDRASSYYTGGSDDPYWDFKTRAKDLNSVADLILWLQKSVKQLSDIRTNDAGRSTYDYSTQRATDKAISEFNVLISELQGGAGITGLIVPDAVKDHAGEVVTIEGTNASGKKVVVTGTVLPNSNNFFVYLSGEQLKSGEGIFKVGDINKCQAGATTRGTAMAMPPVAANIPQQLKTLSERIKNKEQGLEDERKELAVKYVKEQLGEKIVDGKTIGNNEIVAIVESYIRDKERTDVQVLLLEGQYTDKIIGVLKNISTIASLSLGESLAAGVEGARRIGATQADLESLAPFLRQRSTFYVAEEIAKYKNQSEYWKYEADWIAKRKTTDPRWSKSQSDGKTVKTVDQEKQDTQSLLNYARGNLEPKLAELLQVFVQEAGLQGFVNISYRTKGLASAMDKLARLREQPWAKGKDVSIADLVDLMGGRIVVDDLRSLENIMLAVERIIKEKQGDPRFAGMRILRKENKFIANDGKADPYRAVQYTITFPGKDGEQYTFELQLKTFSAMIASDLFHNAVYKAEVLNLPGDLQQTVREYNWQSDVEETRAYLGEETAKGVKARELSIEQRIEKAIAERDINTFYDLVLSKIEAGKTSKTFTNKAEWIRTYDLINRMLNSEIEFLNQLKATRPDIVQALAKASHDNGYYKTKDVAGEDGKGGVINDPASIWLKPELSREAIGLLTEAGKRAYNGRYENFKGNNQKLSVGQLDLLNLSPEALRAFFKTTGKDPEAPQVKKLIQDIESLRGASSEQLASKDAKKILNKPIINLYHQSFDDLMAKGKAIVNIDARDKWNEAIIGNQIKAVAASVLLTEIGDVDENGRPRDLGRTASPNVSFTLREKLIHEIWVFALQYNGEFAFDGLDRDGNKDPEGWRTADPEGRAVMNYEQFVTATDELGKLKFANQINLDRTIDEAIFKELAAIHLKAIETSIVANRLNPIKVASLQRAKAEIIAKYVKALISDRQLAQIVVSYIDEKLGRDSEILLRGNGGAQATLTAIQEEIISSQNKSLSSIPEYKLRHIINEPYWQKQSKLWRDLLNS